MLTREITVKPSRWLLTISTCLFLVVFISQAVHPQSSEVQRPFSHFVYHYPWWFGMMATSVLYCLFMYEICFMRSQDSIIAVRPLPDDNWMVATRVKRYQATLAPYSIVTPFVSILIFYIETEPSPNKIFFKQRNNFLYAVVMRDSMYGDEYRQLTVVARLK